MSDDWDDLDDVDDVDIEPASPQPTKAPVLLATEGKAPTLTPAQASAAIDAKMRDSDFRAKYFDQNQRDEAGHRAAVAEMARLHALATPGEKDPLLPLPIEPKFKFSDKPKEGEEGEQTEQTEAEREAAAELVQAKLEAAHLLGENAEERIEGARNWLGDNGIVAVHSAGFGNDAVVIAEIAELSERDAATDGLIGATINEMLGKGVVYARAGLERANLNADREFQKILKDGGDPRRGAAMAKMTALSILEKPSPWMKKTVEALYATRRNTR